MNADTHFTQRLACIVLSSFRWQVTLKMLMMTVKLPHCSRVIANALHKRNIYFRRLRSKPRLTEQDIQDRLEWAAKYRSKSRAGWLKHLDFCLDLKNFQVFLTGKARHYAAMRQCRGAYRQKGQGLDKGYVRPSKTLKFNTGSPSVMIACAIGHGRLRVWKAQGKWNGPAAAHFYKHLKGVAVKVAPKKQYHRILEDNDPAGLQSGAGREAKAELRLTTFSIPKRSPDLNPLDFGVWKEVSRRMREQEQHWPEKKTETREAYLKRLSRTARALPAKFINACIADLRRRAQRLYERGGELFEEGGREAAH